MTAPLVSFHRFIPQARLPLRADRAALGTLPTRAFRYCEPVATAAALGYYVFPPISFTLLWDGAQIRWSYPGGPGFQPLNVAQFPYFQEHFDQLAPPECRGFAPPFIGALPEPGMIQLWSGLVARTRPGWSLLLRGPANLPHQPGYELFEGLVRTDRWFGPLFGALRLTRTNEPIHFRDDQPLFQAQPLPNDAFDEKALGDYELVPDLAQLNASDWEEFRRTVVRSTDTVRRPGTYARDVRKPD